MIFRQPLRSLSQLTQPDASPAAQRALLVAFCLALFVPTLFRGLINPDETRYAEISREMVESGDWIVLHLNYVPFLEKPPLTNWLVAVSIRLFGLHPWSVRLAPVLAALLGILVTYELGSAISSRRTGLIAGLLLATTIQYFILAVSLVTDMVFSAFLVGAWWAFWRHYQSGGQTRRWIVLFWLLTGLACLAKGPLGLVFVAFTIGLFLFLRGDLRFVRNMRLVTGIVILCATNLPWMIALYRRDPRFIWFFYVQLHLTAVGGAEIVNTEPLLYYFAHIPAGLLPWTLPAMAALVLAAREVVRQGGKRVAPGLLWLISIVVGGLLLLTASKAKLATYSLPLFPAVILITAHYIDKMDARSWPVRLLVPLQSLVALSVLVGSLAGSNSDRLASSLDNAAFWAVAIVGAALVAGLIVASVLSLRARFGAGLLVTGIAAALALPTIAILSPALATWRTASQTLCEQFRSDLASADLVIVSDAEDYAVPLSLGRRVAILDEADELGAGLWVQAHPNRPIPADPSELEADEVDSPYLLDNEGLNEIWKSDRSVCLFASHKFKSRFSFAHENLWVLGQYGGTTLMANRDPSAGR